MTKFFTGIGSRQTPIEVGKIEAKIAFKLSNEGWILRSGGAYGSDKFFELGVDNAKKQKRIYTPQNYKYDCDERNVQEVNDALSTEPHINLINLKEYTQLLFKRNVYQILGDSLENTLSSFCIFWIPCENIYDRKAGGTRIAARIAEKYNIPIFNIFNNIHKERLIKYISNVIWEPTIKELEQCINNKQNKQLRLY